MSQTQFYGALHQADVILTPYDRAAYRYRSSGVAAQAVAHGKIAVVPAGTAASIHTRDPVSVPPWITQYF